VTNVKIHHPSFGVLLRQISHIPAIRLQERNGARAIEAVAHASVQQRMLAACAPTS